jgi:hypothetical protein
MAMACDHASLTLPDLDVTAARVAIEQPAGVLEGRGVIDTGRSIQSRGGFRHFEEMERVESHR